jgi:hypothetical protein
VLPPWITTSAPALFDVPAKRDTAPAGPPVAAPLEIRISPDLPLLVVPELNRSTPLAPTATAFALRITISPLDETDPAPLTTLTAPPTCPDDVVSPARIATSPPRLESTVPTEILIEPAELPTPSPVEMRRSPTAPFLAVPEAMRITPVDPEEVVPLLKTRSPLEPTLAALADRITTAPLDDAFPAPLTMLMTPPTPPLSRVEPPITDNIPPSPDAPSPTTMLIAPP